MNWKMPKWKVKLIKGTFGCDDIKVCLLREEKKNGSIDFFFIEKENKEIENIVCVNVSYCPY